MRGTRCVYPFGRAGEGAGAGRGIIYEHQNTHKKPTIKARMRSPRLSTSCDKMLPCMQE